MTSIQVQEWLRSGIAAAQAGDTERAYQLLLKVVDIDEYNEQAWLWLSSVVETDADREVCLENVLAINAENKVAKAGLVHLHSKGAQPVESAKPEPVPPIPPAPAALETDEVAVDDAAEMAERSEEPLAAPAGEAAEPVAEPDAGAVPPAGRGATWEMPSVPWREPFTGALVGRLVIAALFVAGLVAAGVALATLLDTNLLDPARREYSRSMQPLLEAYDAWWDGPQGELVAALDNPCGPDANDWRNADVLVACSRYPAVACTRLARHCGDDVEEMREQVQALARQAGAEGRALLRDLEVISPPAQIASAHAHLAGCLRAQVAEADRVGDLAQGEPRGAVDAPPACAMFPSAEQEVRAYVNGP
jgi:hypothetical protein